MRIEPVCLFDLDGTLVDSGGGRTAERTYRNGSRRRRQQLGHVAATRHVAAIRCRALGVGLLSGGYGPDELRQSGAFRVYEDPADLLRRIDEVGGQR